MHRQIVYPSAIPQDTDLLLTNKNTMVSLGYLMQAMLGTSTVVDGLACTPTGPASMTVNVAGGSIYSLAQIDATAYGSIAADTADQIMKQGIVIGTQNFSCPAPVTSGQSVVYLVEATFQEVDGGSTVLDYYNSANPAVPFNGPGGLGGSNFTVRQGLCTVQVKTGVAATTGTQVTPTPDAGFTGLYAITVANGQTTITSGSIAQLNTAPFIGAKLPELLTAIQTGTVSFAHDTSVSANTITVALNPDPGTLTDGMKINVKVANSSTAATVINTNGHGNVAAVTTSGAAFTTNTVVANGIYSFTYDGNGTRWQLQGFTAASATGLLPANNLSDVSSVTTSRTNLGAAASGANTDITSLSAPALGAATATTQSVGDSTTKVATTAFVNPGGSIGANGHRENPDGTIEQWATATSSGSGGTAITFPIPFPNACFGVVGNINSSSTSPSSVVIGSITTSGFSVVLYAGAGVFQSGPFFYRAIGN
jgi:hypothetical protein